MDVSLIEMNHGKESMVLLRMFQNILGIEVWRETRDRYLRMMDSRAKRNKKKLTPKAAKRRRELKRESLKVNAGRSAKASAEKKMQYKEPSSETYVSL